MGLFRIDGDSGDAVFVRVDLFRRGLGITKARGVGVRAESRGWAGVEADPWRGLEMVYESGDLRLCEYGRRIDAERAMEKREVDVGAGGRFGVGSGALHGMDISLRESSQRSTIGKGSLKVVLQTIPGSSLH